MKPVLYLSLLLGMPLYYGCTSSAAVENKMAVTDTIPVQVMPLQQQYANTDIAVSGQFTTDDEVLLSFKTSGIISSLTVKEGDAVKKGQLLASLNPTEINAQLQQAKLAAEKSQRDFQRTQNLYKDSVATLEQLQNAQTTMQQAQQQLEMASFNQQYSQIRAPQDGFILRKLANAGQQVTAGTPVLQTNGAQGNQWMLRAGVSDHEWATMQLNDHARITTAAINGQTLEGVVSRKSEGVDPATGTLTVYITVTGERPRALAAGMFGKAVIQPVHRGTGAGAASWQIPYEALLDGDGNSGYVFVTNDNKTAHKIKVTVAGINKNTVTISDGLQQANALVIAGSAYLTDNSAIRIQSPVTPAQ